MMKLIVFLLSLVQCRTAPPPPSHTGPKNYGRRPTYLEAFPQKAVPPVSQQRATH